MSTFQTNILLGPCDFYAGNHKYRLTVGISDGYGKNDFLLTKNINILSFDNRMNRLYDTGYIEYTDDKAMVDKFIESDSALVSIEFGKYDLLFSGSISTEPITTTRRTFLIDSVNILSNELNVIKYRLNLISESFVMMHRNVRQSTYGVGEKTITDIIRDILQTDIGINVNVESFNKNASEVKINYISDINDDGYSSIGHLFNKTVYNGDQADGSLRTLVYNHESNIAYLLNLKSNMKEIGIYNPILIRVIKNGVFPGYETKTYIGYTDKYSRMRTLVNSLTVEFYKLNGCSFPKTKTLENKSILNIMNGGIDNGAKFCNLTGTNMTRNETEWNNSIDLYNNMFTSVTQSNGLITNTDGLIGAMAGFTCLVTVPNIFQTLNQSKLEQQNEDSKYLTFTGQWDIYEVEDFISPIDNVFKLKLVLFRLNNI